MSERDERVEALALYLWDEGLIRPEHLGRLVAEALLDSPAMRDLLAEERRATAERIARAIEAGVLPWHPNEGYKDGFRHAAQIARETV